MEDLISVIVPIYNLEEFIEKCVISLEMQTYHHLQIILVNDGSKDKSLEICLRYQKQDERILLIDRENGGVSSARNEGLKHATGKYIAFIDGDDFCELDMFEKLVHLYEENNNLELAICGFEIRGKHGVTIWEYEKSYELEQLELIKGIFHRNNFRAYLWNKLFLREVIERNEIWFDESIAMCEDTLFCYEYIKNIKKGKFLNLDLYHYTIREDAATQMKFNKKRMTVWKVYQQLIESVKIYKDTDLMEMVHVNSLIHCMALVQMLEKSEKEEEKKLQRAMIEKIKREKEYFRTSYCPNKYRIKYLILVFARFLFRYI